MTCCGQNMMLEQYTESGEQAWTCHECGRAIPEGELMAQEALIFDKLPAMSKANESILAKARQIFSRLGKLEMAERIETINALRAELHQASPFSREPVDLVVWVPAEVVIANDYNPNTVAPPEMKLLEHSISEDGYTQPIVAWKNEYAFEVVDGFHRNRVGRECRAIKERVLGYLPLTVINSDRLDRGDRIAATIRHNRARGKHRIAAMSEIVVELKRRNWSDEKIGRDLGMDPDEVLRLSQISGLAEMFADREFSQAWEADTINESDNLDIEAEGDPNGTDTIRE